MTAIWIAAGWIAVSLLCGLSYWFGTRVQAAKDFEAIVGMLRLEPIADAETEAESRDTQDEHYGMP